MDFILKINIIQFTMNYHAYFLSSLNFEDIGIMYLSLTLPSSAQILNIGLLMLTVIIIMQIKIARPKNDGKVTRKKLLSGFSSFVERSMNLLSSTNPEST